VTQMAQDKRVAVVEARGVHKHFGQNHVLKGVDLTVYKGEVVVIIGPSGGGKSTFLRTINHLDRPDSGEVCINGDALGVSPKGSRRATLSDAGLSRQRRQVGMVFQQFNLFSHMTALENVMCGPVQVLKTPRAVAETDAKRLLALVGLADKEASYPAQLSGGQPRRVTHEVQFARKAADRILFMEEGRIIEEGRPEELMGNPRNERTRSFLRMVTGEA